ncbi:MAG: hypothetical protein LUO79_08160 [Methanomassiliicoccales archaeon]|nr:hypothetical protein [Methanomassiliicoccales archaeon]
MDLALVHILALIAVPVVGGLVSLPFREGEKDLIAQTPGPKLVIASGDCASTGAPFQDCYNHNRGVDSVIPVDVFVPGCAYRPEPLIDAVVLGIEKWRAMVEENGSEEDERPDLDHEVKP